MENYTVLVPPYTVGPEAYRSIPEYCRVYGTTAVVIGGKKAMAAAHDKLLAAVDGSEIAISGFFHFGTECTFSAAHALEAEPAIQNADMIFAVGGGQGGGHRQAGGPGLKQALLHLPHHRFQLRGLLRPGHRVQRGRQLLRLCPLPPVGQARLSGHRDHGPGPHPLPVGGIGDTYAKFYEVSISARGEQLEQFRAAGVTLCRMCLDTMREHGASALEANRAGQSTYDLEQVVLTIVITTGWVSMLVARDHTMDYNGAAWPTPFTMVCAACPALPTTKAAPRRGGGPGGAHAPAGGRQRGGVPPAPGLQPHGEPAHQPQ